MRSRLPERRGWHSRQNRTSKGIAGLWQVGGIQTSPPGSQGSGSLWQATGKQISPQGYSGVAHLWLRQRQSAPGRVRQRIGSITPQSLQGALHFAALSRQDCPHASAEHAGPDSTARAKLPPAVRRSRVMSNERTVEL